MYGAISAQENDNGALNLSNLNVDMMRLQPEVMEARQQGADILYYSLYGDAIFPLLNCITGRHRQPLQGVLNVRDLDVSRMAVRDGNKFIPHLGIKI